MENNNLFRPYNNGLEFINDAKKHGPYVKCINNSIVGLKSSNGYCFPMYVADDLVYVWGDYGNATLQYKKGNFESTLKSFQWQDGTPCGIIKETNDGE